MPKLRTRRISVAVTATAVALSLAIASVTTVAVAQTPAAPKKPVPTTKKPATGVKKPPATTQQRGPLSKADVERLWKAGNEEILLNELRLRALAFEPEEAWLSSLDPSRMPQAAGELKKSIPPAPTPEEVAAKAADLLTRVKAAAQKRDEEALKPLLHPELLANKAKVYDLFDTSNYRDHSLGRFSPADNRRVGVQFFQLTTSQVERLHYVQFSTSQGNLVVRDIVTGPQVADAFLKDEKALALSKLDLAFRAFNDGDDAGLRNTCTQGLYDNLKNELSGGARLTRGKLLRVQDLNPAVSADLDHKSIRPVVRVSFPTNSGQKIEFDVDFERIGNDLKVVRLRDVQNRVIAWDSNIDNYLNRRYGLPDAAVLPDPPQGWTDVMQLQPLNRIRQLAYSALYTGNTGKIQEFSQEISESLPASGEGAGIKTALLHLEGKNPEALSEALRAIDRGGTAYFSLLRHKAFNTQEFWPVVLGISKDKILYKPIGGDSSEPVEIAIGSVNKITFDTGRRLPPIPARPFLRVEFRDAQGKEQSYNFAAFGTSCTPGQGKIQATGQVCPATGATPQPQQQKGRFGLPGLGGANAAASSSGAPYVRTDWRENLQVVQQTIEEAKKKAPQKR